MFKSSLSALSTVVQLLSILGIDDDEINLTFYNTSTEMICRYIETIVKLIMAYSQ